MAQDFDAVFIGAGHNALASAIMLAQAGWRVALFERGAVPGGAVQSGEYTLPGFRHDWAAMNLSLFAGSPFVAAHGAALTRHGLAFAPAADCFASVFEDGRWLGVSTDLEATAARIAGFSPRDAQVWRDMAAAFPGRAPHLFAALGAPPRIGAFASIAAGALRGRGLRDSLAMAGLLRASARDWLGQHFESPQLRAMMAAWGMHLDFAPDVPGGAVFPYLESMANQGFGMALGQGGADVAIRAMTGLLAELGGVIETGAEVTAITRDGQRATGITLADGRTIIARRAVIAGVAPAALVRLAGPMAPGFDRAMCSFRHAPGTMMIHLALDAAPDWRAGTELQRFAYVHIAPDLDMMQRAYDQARQGLLPARPVLVVGQPCAVDPGRAPNGKAILWVQVRMAPGIIAGDGAGQIAARDWSEAAAPFAARAIDLIEAHAPGLRARIIGQRVVTPVELEASNPNLVGGDQICGSHHLGQHFLRRPARGHADGSTPLENLWLTGAAVWPGAGTGAGSGRLLAENLLTN
ncbi:MAG: NAD(P)/FAD-dependent oxidoreductase [Paracoccus sp. (in: a-proteobacteria)]|nr:NAD(P)/FAD-dependent oxidoreductase [Paracoccus sp. (in: a-proteobacteria)]